MHHDKFTVIVDPAKEPRAYPVWEFAPPKPLTKIAHKQGKWCWTTRTIDLPGDLQGKFDTCSIEDIYRIVETNPAYFFYGVDNDSIIWERPCQHGKDTPPFSGVDTRGNIHLVEIVWHNTENIYDHIQTLIKNYAPKYAASKLGYGKPCTRKLTFHLAFSGEISSQCLSDLITPKNSLHQQLNQVWNSVHMRFGAMQVGWNATNPEAHLLRVYWFDSSNCLSNPTNPPIGGLQP